MGLPKFRFEEVGIWSEIKIEIIKKYAKAYSNILTAQKKRGFSHVYIDAFSGPGMHVSKTSKETILGSPLRALEVEPPFDGYHFIDINPKKISNLKYLTQNRENVHIYQGDCNEILLQSIFPIIKREKLKRGLCLLDPYGLHLDWSVVHQAGLTRKIDIFINFPTMDIHRNVLVRDKNKVKKANTERMDAFWGDKSWMEIAYILRPTLFGEIEEKTSGKALVEGYIERLKKIACFTNIAKPLPMRNSQGSIIYYLLFASQKPVAKKIINEIIRKYELRGLH